MIASRALSSFEGTYNSIRDAQRSSAFDMANGLTKFSAFKYTSSKPNRQLLDTKAYLQQIEEKYEKKPRRQRNDSDSDFEEKGPQKAPSQVPSKFINNAQSKKSEFHIPKDLTLSRGPSEQCVQLDNRLLVEMQQKYLNSGAPSTIVDQDAKRRFFELAVELKNKLPKDHPGQEALVAQLYTECTKKQIPERYWRQWLTNRLES